MDINFHSQHLFIFPFSWQINSNNDNRFNLEQISEFIQEKNIWEQFQFKNKVDDNINTYNIYSYFYEYARDVLNLNNDPNNDINARQYQVKFNYSDPTYEIDIIGEETIKLKIQDIMLGFYENGVGIMAFHLLNYQTKDFKLILKINEYGRRIYPQYLGVEQNEYTKPIKEYGFLADKITLKNIFPGDVEEGFKSFDTNLDTAIQPKHIFGLLGSHFGGNTSDYNKCVVKPILDDRMFVISHILDNELAKEFTCYCAAESTYALFCNKETINKWYRYIFIDDSKPGCSNFIMRKEMVDKHTYKRWINHEDPEGSQIYGLSRYSFVMLSGQEYFPKNIVSTHMANQYFDLVLLCLLQRAYLLLYSKEVARISKSINASSKFSQKNDISTLYLNYIKFKNRIYFREVTAQEQGIELYDMLQEKMRIQLDVDSLGKEIEELNEYMETQEQSNLSKVANDFLPLTLIASLIGMNTCNPTHTPNELTSIPNNDNWWNTFSIFDWVTYSGSIILVLYSIVKIYKQFQKNKIWNR